jgi:hypothetical protein
MKVESTTETITKSYTESLTTATTKTLAQTESKTVDVACDSSKYADAWATALYQWLAISHDGEITVSTIINLCRYNELA